VEQSQDERSSEAQILKACPRPAPAPNSPSFPIYELLRVRQLYVAVHADEMASQVAKGVGELRREYVDGGLGETGERPERVVAVLYIFGLYFLVKFERR
jgi:hypothetical protein